MLVSFRSAVTRLLVGVSLGMTLLGCSDVRFSTMVSPAEKSAREGSPFAEPFDPNRLVAGVLGGDAYIPSENLRLPNLAVVEAQQEWVRDCSAPGVYEKEKAEVLAEAMRRPGRVIPVAYSISFGSVTDEMALWAHHRAVLSESNVGVSYIPVGGRRETAVKKNGKDHDVYYVASHERAKRNFVQGRRCFFDTVEVFNKVDRERKAHTDRYDFIQSVHKHNIHFMYYGWCAAQNTCSPDGNYAVGEFANRLFSELPESGASAAGYVPQIVKLYMADIREGHFGLKGKQVLKVGSRLVRGQELVFDFKSLLNMREIHLNFGRIVRNLSAPYRAENGLVFAGMVGVPQLLHNILSLGAEGTVLASQYTPIVLDLGQKGVYTSSVTWGSYFNLAGLQKPGATGLETYRRPHRTAWLSGPLVDAADAESRAMGFPIDARRSVEDGFLAIPDQDGAIRSSRNLFGNFTNGQRYEDGFAALRAFVGKNCESDDVRDRYVGPWDAKFRDLRIWIDADRNGESEAGEVFTLAEKGVLAIHACYVQANVANSSAAASFLEDAHGNGTRLRTAFLMAGATDLTTGSSGVNEEEIIRRLSLGTTSAGASAEFRLAIDLVFKTLDGVVLED
ncbi:MAG: hypothetical protein NDI61_14525 [Bdellovibrionaceae bacterium]|nr:hypothetical protein [Pseudobdellovibrionaceae bacterium]